MEKQHAQARLQFQQGLSIGPLQAAEAGYKKSGAYPDLNWKFRILTAEARIRVDRYTESLEILQPEPPANLSPDIFLRRRLIQGYTHCYMNKYEQADSYFQMAEAIQKQNGLNEADLDYFRGRCELNRSQLKKADEYLHKALNTVPQNDLALKEPILTYLGWAARSDSRNEEAIEWFTSALAIARTLHAPTLEQRALGERGVCFNNVYDFANAEKDLKEALDISSHLDVLDEMQQWLRTLGAVQQSRNELGAAEVSYKRALGIAQDRKDTFAVVQLYDSLTAIRFAEKDIKGAEEYYSESAKLVPPANRTAPWKLNDGKIAFRHGEYTLAIQKLNALLQQINDRARSGNKTNFRFEWEVEHYLAESYAAMGDTANTEKWFLQGIDTVEQAIHNAKNERYKTTIRDNIPIYDGYVEFLVRQNQPEKALEVAQLGRARSLLPDAKTTTIENPKTWMAKVQRAIRNRNVILFSYYTTDNNSYLWVVTPLKTFSFTLGVNFPEILALASSYRSEIQNHLPIASSPAARRLFQILVQPALKLVPKGSHVMVLGDTAIYNLNFDTLISSEGGDHYWIDDVDVQYASSIDLLLQSNRASPSNGLLLIGAPTQADPQYPPLPHAPQEMESVRKHFAKSDVTEFSGSNATPESYMQNSPARFKYLHFATHGTADALQFLDSAIILSTGKAGKFKLTAEEIADPKLRLNADLVTISACEGTGKAIQSLEGLLGLEWAFMRAGARQVVAALWDVDDTVTPGLMDDFYGELKKGETAAEALRHAKLKILHSNSYYAAPYYWAPLQVYTRF